MQCRVRAGRGLGLAGGLAFGGQQTGVWNALAQKRGPVCMQGRGGGVGLGCQPCFFQYRGRDGGFWSRRLVSYVCSNPPGFVRICNARATLFGGRAPLTGRAWRGLRHFWGAGGAGQATPTPLWPGRGV
jgi:hypothetical protein